MHTLLLIVALLLFVSTAFQPTSAPSWPKNLAWGLAVFAAAFIDWDGVSNVVTSNLLP